MRVRVMRTPSEEQKDEGCQSLSEGKKVTSLSKCKQVLAVKRSTMLLYATTSNLYEARQQVGSADMPQRPEGDSSQISTDRTRGQDKREDGPRHGGQDGPRPSKGNGGP